MQKTLGEKVWKKKYARIENIVFFIFLTEKKGEKL